MLCDVFHYICRPGIIMLSKQGDKSNLFFFLAKTSFIGARAEPHTHTNTYTAPKDLRGS